MKKKILITIIVLALLMGSAYGGVYEYQNYKDEHTFSNVVAVSSINSGYTGQDMQTTGMVTNDMAQSIYLKDSQTVSKVYVKEGDTVSIGEPILEYDVSSVKISVEMKQLEIQGIQNDITIATRDLTKLQATTPVDKTPPKVKPSTETKAATETETQSQMTGTAYNYIDAASVPYKGSGTSTDPFCYLCTIGCYIKGSYLNSLLKNSYYANFEIRANNLVSGNVLSSWLINGAGMDKVDDSSEWLVASREQFTGTSENQETETESETETETEPETEWVEPQGYTKEELAKAIADKQSDLKDLDIKIRTAQLELKKLQKQVKDSKVYASINGIVKTIEDPNNLPNDGSAFLTVYGSDGLYIKGQVNELLLDKVKVGQEVSVTSWQSGSNFQAKITEISTYPDEDAANNGSGGGNPNSSFYDFTAYVENSTGLSNGESVNLNMTIGQGGNANSLYIDKAYVRKQNGNYYVLKEGKKKRLVKQKVVTGKTYYGSIIELKSGIKNDDFIAFPYGKTAKEGVRIKKSDTTNYAKG